MHDSPNRLAALIGGCLLACVPPTPASDSDAEKSPPAPSEPETPSEPPDAPAPTPVDRAYVSVDGVGLHVLDERGWRLLLETRAPIRDMSMHDGKLLVLSAFGIQRVDADGKAETVVEIEREIYSQIGEPLEFESSDGLAFVVTGPLGAARHSSGTWEMVPREDMAATQLQALLAAPPAEVENGDACSEYDHTAVSSDKTKAVIAGRCGVIHIALDGGPTPKRIGIADGWPGQPVRSLALDAGGRVWVGTYNGLTIVAADGQIAEYPISQLVDMAGQIGSILVEGNGPPPPTLGRVRNGGLTGVIVKLDGEQKVPLPNVRLDLCSHLPPGGEIVPDPERSPCAGVDPTHTTTTDATGKFEFTSLPIDHYWFGVEIDGRWARGQPRALNMRAGMSGNVGKVTVAVPE